VYDEMLVSTATTLAAVSCAAGKARRGILLPSKSDSWKVGKGIVGVKPNLKGVISL
jgi:hypothetical protein